jgi:hypothetical protein
MTQLFAFETVAQQRRRKSRRDPGRLDHAAPSRPVFPLVFIRF